MDTTESVLRIVLGSIDSDQIDWIADPNNYNPQLGAYCVGKYLISKEMLDDIISHPEHYRQFLAEKSKKY